MLALSTLAGFEDGATFKVVLWVAAALAGLVLVGDFLLMELRRDYMKKRKRRMTTNERIAAERREAVFGDQGSGGPPGPVPFFHIEGEEVSNNVWEDIETDAEQLIYVNAKAQKGNRASRIRQVGR